MSFKYSYDKHQIFFKSKIIEEFWFYFQILFIFISSNFIYISISLVLWQFTMPEPSKVKSAVTVALLNEKGKDGEELVR